MSVVHITGLLILAAACGLFAYRYDTMNSFKRNSVYGVGMLSAAIAVALVIFVVTSSIHDYVLKRAGGTHRWADGELAHLLLILGPPAVGGYWMWIWYRSKYSDD